MNRLTTLTLIIYYKRRSI